MNISISSVSLKDLYNKYKQEYLSRRGSTDQHVWDESYKWDVLPKLSKELGSYKSVTRDNAEQIIDVYLRLNPQQGTLVDWREADDLKTLVSKPNGWQLINEIWSADTDGIDELIDSNNNAMALLGMPGKKFSPRTYGYLLAGKNPDIFPVFLQSKYDFLKSELKTEDEWRSASLGEKYQLFTEAAVQLGNLLKNDLTEHDVNGVKITNKYTALDGQDFIYVIEHIVNGTEYTKPHESKSIKTEIDEKSLQESLRSAIMEYSDQSRQKFGSSKFSELITEEIPSSINSLINNQKYIVKGSVGQGQWAETPWVAILNPLITKSTRNGYYVCYLIEPKNKTLFLTLMVGWTQFEEQFESSSIAKSRVVEYCDYLSSQLEALPKGFNTGVIDLEAQGTLSRGYELAQILSKKYSISTLNETELHEDLLALLDTYDELSKFAGDSITNIDYERVSSRKELPTSDRQINKLTLLTNIDDVKKALDELITDKKPSQVTVIVKKAARNPKISRLFKQSKKYICELCERKPFIQQNGEPYAEADHIKPLGWEGPDSPDNLRCLCAQCHAVITHGSKEEKLKLLSNKNMDHEG